jgi:uncharacterized SAM-binding protein YcdF (DUF218 family)
MQALKDFFHIWLSPLMLALSAAAVAAALRFAGRRRVAFVVGLGAVAIAYLGSIALVGDALCEPLEYRYPGLDAGTSLVGVRHVVVLGTGFSPAPGRPVTAALDQDGLVRLVEGVRIYRTLPDARLVVSGGASPPGVPSAYGYAELARGLGIDAQRMDVLDKPRDTREEAQAIRNLLGSSPFVLVTTAVHMTRAMRLMMRAGLHPIPAATGQTVESHGWRRYVPTGRALRTTERALHEYAGLFAMNVGDR